jgi:hypothetical protein
MVAANRARADGGERLTEKNAILVSLGLMQFAHSS